LVLVQSSISEEDNKPSDVGSWWGESGIEAAVEVATLIEEIQKIRS